MMHKAYFLTLLLLVFCSQPAFSQQWEELNKHFDTLYENKDFDKALDAAAEVLEASEKDFGINSRETRKALLNMARSFQGMEIWDKSLQYYNELLKLEIDRISKIDTSMSVTIETLVKVYDYLTDQRSAVEVYELAVARLSQVNTLDYSIYTDLSGYYSSKVMAQSTLHLPGNGSPHTPPGTAQDSTGRDDRIQQLAHLCQEHKKFARVAEGKKVCRELYDLKKKDRGEEDMDHARACMHLGYFHMLSTDYEVSAKYYREGIALWEEKSFQKNAEYGDALYFNSLAYQIKQQYWEAKELLLKAEKVAAKLNPNEYYLYPGILSLLANMQQLTGGHGEAEKSYYKYRDSLLARNDTNPAAWLGYYMGIGPVYESLGKWKEADKIYVLYSQTSRELINQLFKYLTVSSEQNVAQTFAGFKYNLNFYNSYCMKRKSDTPELVGQMYNNELIHKGLILRALKIKTQRILNSGDRELINDFETWLTVRQQLAKLSMLPVSDRKVNVIDLEKKAMGLENRINSKLHQNEEKETLSLDWKDVQTRLKPNEAAIEFVDFEHFDLANQIWTGQTIYGALVIRPGYEQPVFITLFQEGAFKDFLDKNREADPFEQVRRLYTWLPGKHDGYYQGDALYGFVWKPIEEYLEGVDKVYYSPSGLLHKISFAALPISAEKSLINKYRLQLMSSTGLLVHNDESFMLDTKDRATLYGGIRYDLDPGTAVRSAQQYRGDQTELFIRDRSFAWSRPESRGDSWSYLEGTLKEVQQIDTLFSTKKLQSKTMTGEKALEESFKKTGQNHPELIHIATHGFFFPEKTIEKKKRMVQISTDNHIDPDNALKRSGLLFAGANNTWQGKQLPDGLEDGVLTSYEVSKLNLINTKLVVLSACETGLGDIGGGEGVYGLQRAFKLAGVNYIIMSLWQIPDEQTVELMKHFYAQWLGGTELHTAFHNAQQFMAEQYEAYFWGAFVLMQ